LTTTDLNIDKGIILNIIFMEITRKIVDWIYFSGDIDQRLAVVNTVINIHKIF
jgi:hypothetical protein